MAPELSTGSRCVCETLSLMPPSPALPDDAPLRIAWLVYRGNPHCGGQGVYTRYLARELTDLGHDVTVFSGQPYPELDDPRQLVEVPGLDLYAEPHPFWPPWPWEIKSTIDLREFGIMCGAGLPRAVRVQPPRPPAPPGPPRRLRHRARQPVPRHRAAHDDARRRLARALHAAPPDHRRPRPRAHARHERVPAFRARPLVRVPQHADARRAADPATRHRVALEQARHRRADERVRRIGSTSCRSVSTRRSSGRFPRSSAFADG